MRHHLLSFLHVAWLFHFPSSLTWAKTVQSLLWVVPDGKLADLSQTFIAGTTLALAWNNWTSADYIDTTNTLVDLWVTAWDINENPFNQLLTENINLTSPGTYAWTIAIPASHLTFDAKYVLRFKALASTYNLNTADLSSPGFLVLRAASSSSMPTSSTGSSFSSPSMTSTAGDSSSSSSPTATVPFSCSYCGLSTRAKVGIGVGVVVAVLAVACAAYFAFIAIRKGRVSAEPIPNDMVNNGIGEQGKHESTGMPVELPSVGSQAELPVR